MRTRALSLPLAAFLLAASVGHAQNRPAPQLPVGPPRERATYQPPPNAPKYAPDRILVRFRPGTPKPRSEAAHAAVNAQVVRRSKFVRDLDVVRLPEKMTVEAALDAYRKDPAVLYAEPDYVVHVLQNPVTPNDPQFGGLWGLRRIQAPQAWGLSTGNPSVVVGVIDTGIDYNHEDLNANMFRNPLDCNSNGVDDDGNGFIDDCYGIDTFNGDSDPMDDFGHGTHVAGTIGAAGNNGIGVVGVNWQVKLMACKFIGAGGYGYDSGAIACLEYMAAMKDRGVNVVATNNSWGGDAFSQALLEAIDVQRQRGILFIAAAGNAASDNDGSPKFPAGYYLPNIIAVAATDSSDSLALFSNFGGHSVHLGAPGVEILSTTPGNTYSIYSGTSMAAPHVAGAAALLSAQDPSRDWKTIKNLLLAGGDMIPAVASTISQKRLNLLGAMTCSSSTVLSRLQPRTSIATAAVGLSVDLAVLHINCGSANGGVTISLDSGADAISLLDDGLGADQEAGDGIYSGQWTPSATGIHTLAFPGGDVVTVQVLSPYRYSTTTFTWRTITGAPLKLDDTERSGDSALVSSPFPIQFGGGSFDRLYVNSNGNITFTGPFPSAVVEPIPTPATSTVVAPFWDDLLLFHVNDNSIPPADAYWEIAGAAPNRELVIEWRDVSHVRPNCLGSCFIDGRITFQVVFFEGRSDILFNYADVDFGGPDGNWETLSQGRLAAVGVQVTPRVGTQFSYQSASLSDGFAVLWQMGNSAPAITQLSPFTALTSDSAVSVKVLGSNFVPEATARWNGTDVPTTFINSSELRAGVSTSNLSTPGRVQLSAINPGGGVSNQLPFDVYSSHPVPTLGSIPELGSIQVGDPGPKTLTASGSQFVTISVLRWNGSDRPTTTIDSTRLMAEIPASDYAVTGTYEVTIFNPAPGGGTSNALTIQLNNPLPRLYGIWPSFVPVGGPNFTLGVSSFAGSFNSASVVRWNGSDRPTTFVSRDTLEAAISAGDIASVGTAKVTVFNPAPGGGTSNELTFDIVAHPPNDNFTNAIEAQPLPFTYVVDDRGATTEPSDPVPSCDYDEDGNTSQKATVWYKYTPSRNIDLFARADRANNTNSVIWEVLSVWVGTPGALVEHTCGWSMWESVTTDVGFTATAGTTYYFMLSLMQYHNEQGPDLRFFLREADPVPTIDSLSPSSAVAGGPGFTLTINGSNFVPGSFVMWDGPPYGGYGLGEGTFVSSTQMTVFIPAFLIEKAGTGKIAVVNPYSVGGVSNALPFVINPAPSVQFALTVIHSSNGNGTGMVTSNPAGIDCGATCSASFASGTLVTLTATPATGSTFAGWDGDCRGSACILTMDGTKIVWATFTAEVSLSITRAGSGTGTVTSNPPGINCGVTCSASFASGAVVDLTATPATGSTFAGWSGDCSGGVCIMEGPKKVTATFDTAPPPFNFGPPPAPRTVSAGQPAQFTLEVTGQAGFTGTVSFSCTSTVPQGAACSFNPPSVSPGSGAATATLTVTTTARTTGALRQSPGVVFVCLLMPLGLILGAGARRSRQWVRLIGLGILLVVIGTIVACGGGSGGGQPAVNPTGTPAGTYTITVTGTSGSDSGTQNVTLVVN